jgi:hypothetical protein
VSEDQDFEVGSRPEPEPWLRPELTGVAGVDEATALLAELDALPTADQVAVYDKVHRQLQDSLADLDGP